MESNDADVNFADIDKIIYSKYLNGISIEDITHWVNWFSPAIHYYKTDASPENINELIDRMNDIFL
jgi:hypothetical protein